ncbi:peptidase U32 family protein [Paenibacillus flagellatus]|uniref:Collagenase-like protease n=1 Tax=Paenibacillus flagellatus TaxID=2211139 RepID=A0A2V5K2J7_9BACL|nr:peptidase U32 family protein [Paenibacillus flagellatus]PYI53505.1 collagenase-like protease [Paenibacillus flagellatus]
MNDTTERPDQTAGGGFRKPELLVSAGSIEEIAALADAGADAFNIGEQRFGMRLPGDIPADKIAEAIQVAHGKGAKAYVVCNGILHNEVLPALPGYLKLLADAGADGVVFGDPAVLVAMRQAGVKLPLHWNAEMTSTNYVTANYWVSKGATRVFLARELNMDEVAEIKRHVRAEVQVQVHGMTNIYHSKRALLTNYWEHQGQNPIGEQLDAGRRLFLVEEERKEEKYPVYEDASGTHVMSADDVCMLESLHELMEAGIDSFRIEGLLKPLAYNEMVVRCYRKAIDAYAADPKGYSFDDEWLTPIRELQDPDRELSFGFFYKEQVY